MGEGLVVVDDAAPSSQGDAGSKASALFPGGVRKRDGREVQFDEDRIGHAIEMAFRAEAGCPYPDPLAESMVERIEGITQMVIASVAAQFGDGQPVDVETIQDEVERQLMADQAYAVARRYIVYREARSRRRREQSLVVSGADGQKLILNLSLVRAWINEVCIGIALDPEATAKQLFDDVLSSVHEGATLRDVEQSIVLAARARIELEPEFSSIAARALLRSIYSELSGHPVGLKDAAAVYEESFESCIHEAVGTGLLAPAMADFDLKRLGSALVAERDLDFQYLGLQTLYDRYLLHDKGRRIEWPQMLWMRVAMGLALREKEREERAIEFYEALSSFRFCSSTPTLFNAGTTNPQLSSCYLTTIDDDLGHIFKSVRDNALLSKWSGGIGNDWSNVRALGSHIRGTNGRSQGVIPFMKVVNDTAVAVNQGGKRKGAVCAYLEVWHMDIDEFLDLRRNTGDDRRRTHDMNTACWIPDLFMKRVREGKTWTLFSPDEVPGLHDCYGQAFNELYEQYERRADSGEIAAFRRVDALTLWHKMLTALFETGHPWITFKDPANIRSPQDHVGVVHSSNLCTEILLNTSSSEVAVCNLGSINLARHVANGSLDVELLGRTVRTAMRMLDNVIDVNFYPIEEARDANLRHRPVGLGLMGFQDALYQLNIDYASVQGVAFADRSMETISYYAILASTELAAERGRYASYEGSKWDRGLLPFDTVALLAKERGEAIESVETTLDWEAVRAAVCEHGMRNSNCLAIAPTATIANIQGVSQSIEPLFSNLFVKSNLSGDFTSVNRSLVNELRELGLWDLVMLDDLKYHDGSVQEIERVPERLKRRYRTAFEIEPEWLLESAARRQQWIDMGQSLNLYVGMPTGRKLNDIYMMAWQLGLKTTYYLRTRAATQTEKSTLDVNTRGIQPRWMVSRSPSADIVVDRSPSNTHQAPEADANVAPSTCVVDEGCESCQ